MKPEPHFAAFPMANPPSYSRWLATGSTLLALVGGGGVLLRPFFEPRVTALLAAGVLLAWFLALLVCTLSFRLNRHTAQCYREETQQVSQAWWAQHRRQVALVESVLIGAAGTTDLHWRRVLAGKGSPPSVQEESGGQAIRLLQVFGADLVERERQLARQLATTWQQQREPIVLPALQCYWQGSPAGWSAFVQQMAQECPDVQLPEHPEPWQGMASLDAIIERLHGAPAEARILCAGCQSSASSRDARLPAGEAAVLWLLGTQGGVRFTSGERFAAEQEDLAEVALRAVRQAELEKPAEACVAFSQPEVTQLGELGWPLNQHQQDAYWGELEGLQAMVVQTLAACHAEQHASPCAWLASDPDHTLALGVVQPDDASS
ncbi:hypothetical protein [Pseudomonas knackmussii]|uniref:hypothetical protein n=1 Tax=Pseudomonas knackmussii TaxID=65741 RepID=UPI0013636F95|nr:hypothetical protein [Pseudomonas knackmussii]